MIHIHSIRSLGERLDHKFLVLGSPSSHDLFRFRINNRPNIGRDIFFLSALIMKRHPAKGKGFEDVSNVDFWPARDTNSKIRKAKFDEFLHKPKYFFAR